MPLKQLPHLGSIPAGAGEPQNFHCRVQIERVYPRGCGGADSAPDSVSLDGGLSPRVRGSHILSSSVQGLIRSIPAGAGEPRSQPHSWQSRRVYPRGCGGAGQPVPARPSGWGLSPRVRGSLNPYGKAFGPMGSIPAGAGEPRAQRSPVNVTRVYPRGCGGAGSPTPWARKSKGLSPRVRGSLGNQRGRRSLRGSIPAGAGEPWLWSRRSKRSWVYPRGCGGAI